MIVNLKIKNRFTFALLRRLLAISIDLIILFSFSILLAYFQLMNNNLSFLAHIAYPFYLLYFITFRLTSEGTTIGMRIMKIKFIFLENFSFNQLRLIYRTLLHVGFIMMFPSLDQILQRAFHFFSNDFKLSLLSLSLALSIPIYNFLLIIVSNGSYSIFDIICKCKISVQKFNSSKFELSRTLPNFRKYIGNYLILVSMIYFSLLLFNWRSNAPNFIEFLVQKHFSFKPIEKVGMEYLFEKYSRSGFQAISFISNKRDLLLSLYAKLKREKILEVLLVLNEVQFHDKELHSEIASDVEKVRRVYEQIYQEKISKAKLTLRKVGIFGPIILFEDYKYIIWPLNGATLITGDISYKEREKIVKAIQSVGDTIIISYPLFFEKRSEKRFEFEISSKKMYPSVFTFEIWSENIRSFM